MLGIMILAQVVLQIFFFFQKVALLYKMPKSEMVLIQPDMYRIFAIICMPNIMILAQAVLQIFCSHSLYDPSWLKCLSMKRGIIQSNIHRLL